MKSAKRGKPTSAVEVANVSVNGFWLFINGRERFLPFEEFPWFRDATIGQLTNVALPSPHHLYWPELDVDLSVESLDHPERYPLVSAVQAANINTKSRKLASRRQVRTGTMVTRGSLSKKSVGKKRVKPTRGRRRKLS